MAYELEAILGTRATIEAARADLGHAAVVALGQDVAMIPLTDEVLDELISIETREPGGGHVAAILEWARLASRHGRLAYCSAAYFGGDSVNRALQLLGIVCDPGEDEWDTVGLGRCRHTDRWTGLPTPTPNP